MRNGYGKEYDEFGIHYEGKYENGYECDEVDIKYTEEYYSENDEWII